MKKIFLMLVIVFAFGMNANAQDYVIADNNYISSNANENNSLDKSNKADFIKNYGEKAKSISKQYVNGKLIALKRGYTYKGKLHWLIMIINSKTDYEVFTFSSKTNFSNISFAKADKKINLRNYILKNY